MGIGGLCCWSCSNDNLKKTVYLDDEENQTEDNNPKIVENKNFPKKTSQIVDAQPIRQSGIKFSNQQGFGDEDEFEYFHKQLQGSSSFNN